jgi:hypothetical protein
LSHHASEVARVVTQMDFIYTWVLIYQVGSSLDVVQGGETGARLTLFRSKCSVVGGEDWIVEGISCCNESCENRTVLVKLRDPFVRLLECPHVGSVRIRRAIIIERRARGREGNPLTIFADTTSTDKSENRILRAVSCCDELVRHRLCQRS